MSYKLLAGITILLVLKACSSQKGTKLEQPALSIVESPDIKASQENDQVDGESTANPNKTEPGTNLGIGSVGDATSIQTFGRVEGQKKPKISIVIDDLGDNSRIAHKLLTLPAKLTAAILPHTPHARTIANYASERGHEVIMHLPMEAFSRPDLLGPGALYANMLKDELQQTLFRSANSVPQLVGFNNHMGSMLTENNEKMQWVMEVAKREGWYFLDSKTSESSVAQAVARKNGLPSIGRDVFLDHHSNAKNLPAILSKQLAEAKQIAKRRGQVVVICHPYPETLNFLSNEFPQLNAEFELVRLSDLMQSRPETVNISGISR